MVPTLTMLGRLRVATRGAAIPWFETALVTLISMTGTELKVISIPPEFFFSGEVIGFFLANSTGLKTFWKHRELFRQHIRRRVLAGQPARRHICA